MVSTGRASPLELPRDVARLHGDSRGVTDGTRQQPARKRVGDHVLVARVCQSSVHLLLQQTDIVAGVRFTFFFIQAVCMIAMGVIVAISAPSWPGL